MSRLDEIEIRFKDLINSRPKGQHIAIVDALDYLIDRCNKLQKSVNAGKAHIETLVQDQWPELSEEEIKLREDSYYQTLRDLDE